ncbi:thiolase family protein [Nitratireductor indicus]|uniref:thiolase family protein n=1 Tax=Nitratireductor indicus TaxID=721133 RepID=UPI002873F910|nr:thiolase family protein [Nitratireductor indicus]MDS1135144.1 thiolase family protein [Nitratireductor indicus]
MKRVLVTALARTPFGKFRGILAAHDCIDLGTQLIDELSKRDGNPQEKPQIVYGGSGLLGGAQLTTLRQMIIGSGLSNETVSVGVDRACCSGMTAISGAAAWLRSGAGNKALAIGLDSLSNMPVLVSRGSDRKINSLAMTDPLLLTGSVTDKTIAQYTSEEALKAGVDRALQDKWAFQSHCRYFEGLEAGIMEKQLFPVDGGQTGVLCDEGPRPNSNLEKLGTLRVVNNSETITAGNAPGLSDGAAGLILTDESGLSEHTEPLAEIVDWVQVAGHLQQGTSIPAVAVERLLERNQLRLEDVAVIEINEAFAATPLVSLRRLAAFSGIPAETLTRKTNVYGGAVAIGHPLGASGVRIVMQAITILRKRGGGIGICSICGGFGQGEAMIIRV